MKRAFDLSVGSTLWRHLASALALTAALTFPLQTSVSFAQVGEPETPAKADSKIKRPAKPNKAKAAQQEATTEDLNRRASERAVETLNSMTAPAPAPAEAKVASLPAAPQALPKAVAPAGEPKSSVAPPEPSAPVPPAASTQPRPNRAQTATQKAESQKVEGIATNDLNRREAERAAQTLASLTAPAAPVARTTPPPTAAPIQTEMPTSRPLPEGQLTQAQPPVPIPPIARPPATPPSPTVVTGAPSRPFGQSQVVQTQQPAMTLEINKGTAIKLPRPAATVFIAAPDIADVQVKSPSMIFVFAKKPGDTVLYAVDDQDRVLLNTIVRVTSPISRMTGALDALHPGNGVTFDNQGDAIVMTGTVRSALVAEDARRLAVQHVGVASKVINNIRIDPPTQVQLRVKVAEVHRDSLKRVGINWQNINNIALFGLAGLNLGFAVNTVNTTIGGRPGTGALRAQNLNGGLDSFIDFLATQNKATILAEPNLIAMSGETASFLAGQEVPIVSPQTGAAAGTISVTYKNVGVSLAFTPTIVGDRINLKVAPEVSEIDVNSAGTVNVPISPTATVTIPAFITRKAQTTIELGSGQSFAIAGLLLQSSVQAIRKFPWLGDIPVLGTLFKSDAYQRSESELIIIITPYLIEPTNGKLRTPLTDSVPPTDADRLVYQRTGHPTPPNRIAVGRTPQAQTGQSAGFKLD
jgi:pilus assembly protein CpaC